MRLVTIRKMNLTTCNYSKVIFILVQLLRLTPISGRVINHSRYHLLEQNHRASTDILHSASVTSVTSCAAFCSSTDACSAFSIGPVVNGGARECEAVRLNATSLMAQDSWTVFAGKYIKLRISRLFTHKNALQMLY